MNISYNQKYTDIMHKTSFVLIYSHREKCCTTQWVVGLPCSRSSATTHIASGNTINPLIYRQLGLTMDNYLLE